MAAAAEGAAAAHSRATQSQTAYSRSPRQVLRARNRRHKRPTTASTARTHRVERSSNERRSDARGAPRPMPSARLVEPGRLPSRLLDERAAAIASARAGVGVAMRESVWGLEYLRAACDAGARESRPWAAALPPRASSRPQSQVSATDSLKRRNVLRRTPTHPRSRRRAFLLCRHRSRVPRRRAAVAYTSTRGEAPPFARRTRLLCHAGDPGAGHRACATGAEPTAALTGRGRGSHLPDRLRRTMPQERMAARPQVISAHAHSRRRIQC